MPKKKYIVTLTAEERAHLHGLISRGKAAAYKQRHARILLKTDQGPHGEHWTDEQIEHALDVHPSTVERLRQRFVEEGFEGRCCAKSRRIGKRRRSTAEPKPIWWSWPAVSPPRGGSTGP